MSGLLITGHWNADVLTLAKTNGKAPNMGTAKIHVEDAAADDEERSTP